MDAYIKLRDSWETCTYVYSVNPEGYGVFVNLYVDKRIILNMKKLCWEGMECIRLVQNMGHRWIIVDTVKDFLFIKGRKTSLLVCKMTALWV